MITGTVNGPADLQGTIVTGTVSSVKEFGAFVDIPLPTDDELRTITGMVHVSEIAETFVDNIYAHVGEGDEVEVAVMDVADDGKVSLSMKRADPDWLDDSIPDLRPKDGKEFSRKLRRFMHRSQQSQGALRRQKRQRLGMSARRRG